MRHTDVRDCFVRVRARAAFEAPGRVALKACMINQCTTRSVTEKKSLVLVLVLVVLAVVIVLVLVLRLILLLELELVHQTTAVRSM